ncbi:hypothetical protein C2845_PM01G37880 [Panicum miliaceum]|uniref:Uncharacterized protein n=1 Tax=Panicum miliaceum TaxID=4540 RepID=A0A3L6TID0_PANMI|nr:hypothetical protein C2845_PM01G37880 [Panicum miliaceum]
MAGRCGFSPSARLLLLVVLLGAVLLHGDGAVARPLLGIAEAPRRRDWGTLRRTGQAGGPIVPRPAGR